MKKLMFFLLLTTAVACKNQTDTAKTPPPPPPPAAKESTQCFQYKFNKDLTSCQITTDDKGAFVSGYMDWTPYEKDGGHGILKNGKMEGNMLTADWTYMIEGTVQTEEIYLKVEADKITTMSGELVEDKSGKLVAKNKAELKADEVLSKVDCSTLASTIEYIKSIETQLK